MHTLTLLAAALATALTLPAAAGVSLAGTGAPVGLSATTAEAWSVQRQGGTGHIAVVPYFSTQAGNATLLSINNTDLENGKAVKVRFRSAVNGDTLSDFTVLLVPGDVWAANIHQGADGITTLASDDRSCTLPANVRQPFSTARLPASLSAADKASWTREGYIEVITMADIPPSRTEGGEGPLFAAISHSSADSVRCAPSVLNTLRTDPPDEAAARALGLDTPSTGLAVNTTLINVDGASVSWPVPAVALTAVTAAGQPGRGRLVFSAQTAEPANGINVLSNDPLLRTPSGGGNARLTALQTDLPDLSTPYTGSGGLNGGAPFTQIEQIGRMLSVRGLRNEVVLTPAIGAKTDWVVTAPTRRYAVGVDYAGTNGIAVANEAPAGPSSFFSIRPGSPNAEFKQCTGTVTDFDTYSQTRDPILIRFFLVPIPVPLQCTGAEVLTFGEAQENTPLGARTARLQMRANTDGWFDVRTVGTGAGVPLVGGAYMLLRGPEVSGKSTSFGLYYPHAVR